jgi:short-subunit dehydrogenase involved in D-alanine esterification of teichoic acids
MNFITNWRKRREIQRKRENYESLLAANLARLSIISNFMDIEDRKRREKMAETINKRRHDREYIS